MSAVAFDTRPRFAGTAPLAGTARALLWLVGFSGGFVFIEPAPYELVIVLAALVFFIAGMQLRRAHLPLVCLLVVYNIGYAIGVVPVLAAEGTAMWTAVSCFMSVTTLFFALAMGDDTARRIDLLLKGYVAVAVVISIFGIVTYFHLLPGSDTFLFALRSRSTFKDPNVLAAFLVLPGLLAMQRMMLGRLSDFLIGAVMTLLIAVEELLSFSRGGWGAFAAAAVIMLALTFVTGASRRERLRIVVFSAIATAALALLIAVILSVPQVASLFTERASLIQSYDSGRFGRFGRHILGAQLALDHPFGIGPLQFSKIFPEDPHNSFLDAFMAGGWLSGAAYIGLILVTLLIGLRCVFAGTPWRSHYLALYASFVALSAESYVIDVQHWRHYFLIMGVLWGLVVAAAMQRRDGGVTAGLVARSAPIRPPALGCAPCPRSL